MCGLHQWAIEAFDPDNQMGGPGAAALRYMGGKYLPDIRDKYEIYRFITPVLLHAGILHIFFNLLFQVTAHCASLIHARTCY
jgi:membrane associated rhomboid family serine protease